MPDSIGSLAIKLIALTDTLKPGLKQGERDVADWTKRVQKLGEKTIPTIKPIIDFDKLDKSRVRDLDKLVKPNPRQRFRSPADLPDRTASRDLKAPKSPASPHGGGSGLAGSALSGAVAAATFGASLVAESIFGALAGVVTESVELAGNFEKMQISFETLLGNAPAAQKMLADISEFAKDTPFSMTETAGHVKNLLAYGISAGQTIPTIRALGDVASGTGTDLQRIVYAYGQVATAGQLYGTELRQFTEAGVPILEELAEVMGKPKERMKDLIEQGKVGFPEVTKAFKRMTEAGGKFAGLTEKFGKSFSGQVEKLKDSLEIAKREFGTVLIDELGLKDATQDLSKFTDKIKDMANEIRPALRFIGELGRAGAQVGYELGKAAVAFGKIQATTYSASFPELGRSFEGIQKIVKDLKDFKIDPTSIEDAAFDLTEMMALSIAGVLDYGMEMWGKAEDTAGKFLEAANEMKKVAEQINSAISTLKEVRDFKENLGKDPAGTAQKTFGVGQPDANLPSLSDLPKDYGKSQRDIDTDSRSKFLASQERLIVVNREKSAKSGAVPYIADHLEKEARAQIDRWIKEDRALGREAYMKDVTFPELFKNQSPDYTANPLSALIGPAGMRSGPGKALNPPESEKPKGFKPPPQTIRERVQLATNEARRGKDRSQAERALDNAKSAAEQMAGSITNSLRYFGSTLDFVGTKADRIGKQFGDLEIPIQGISKELYELADKLNKEYRDPLANFFDERDKISALHAENMIDQNTYHLATADAFKNVVKGLDLTKRLPTAADYGTAEFAKLATVPFQGGPESVESLLKQLVDMEKGRREEATKISDALLGIERVLDKYRGTPVRSNE